MKTKKAFTLIELLIVIVIIGVLATVVVINLAQSAKEKARIARILPFADTVRAQLSQNPVAWWRFDGSWRDSWGKYHGTLLFGNSLFSDDAIHGQSLESTENVSNNPVIQTALIEEINNSQHFTFSGWFYPENRGFGAGNFFANANFLIGPGQAQSVGAQFYLNGKRISVWFTDPSYPADAGGRIKHMHADTNYEVDKWNHVVIMFNGEGVTDEDRVKIYVNTEEMLIIFSNPPPYITPNIANGSFLINGGSITSATGYLFGNFDEFQMFSESLTAQEVQRLYAESAPKFRMTLK